MSAGRCEVCRRPIPEGMLPGDPCMEGGCGGYFEAAEAPTLEPAKINIAPEAVRAAFFQSLMLGEQSLAGPVALLTVVRRPLLVSGMLASSPRGVAILVDDGQDAEQQGLAIWHEVVHLLMHAGGREQHDEAEVEHIAERLYKACPQVLELCGFPKNPLTHEPPGGRDSRARPRKRVKA